MIFTIIMITRVLRASFAMFPKKLMKALQTFSVKRTSQNAFSFPKFVIAAIM